MKLTKNLIEKLTKLEDGETVPSSSLKGEWVEMMLADGIIMRESHGRHVSYRAVDKEAFKAYIADHLKIRDLHKALPFVDGEATRAEQVQAMGDSKIVGQRTMKGFLVNSYNDIEATLNGEPFTIHPQDGSFTYIYDYESFCIPEDVVVIGMENCENFRQIEKQRYLFSKYGKVLFVSRYPQNGDLIKWLERIPNHYIHFGDFDLAGIHIFLSEFYSHLGAERSEFFTPSDIEKRLPEGSRTRYEVQYPKYGNMEVTDQRLLPLVNLINHCHRGYDQEGYIVATPPPASQAVEYSDDCDAGDGVATKSTN